MTQIRMQDGEWLTGARDPNNAWSSVHVGGSQFVLGDGTVRFISENIQFVPICATPYIGGTYNRLGKRDDGLPIGEF
jgi:hypothetical protein